MLVLSNMVLGTVSVMLLRSLDRRYTDLINRTVPALNNVRSLSSDTFATFRAVGTTSLFNIPKANRPEALALAEKALRVEKKALADVVATSSVAERTQLTANLRQHAQTFDSAVEKLMALVAADQMAAAALHRDETMRPAFNTYFATIGNVADEIEATGLKDSDATTVTMERFSQIMIGLAGWPIILLFGVLLLIMGSVALLLIPVFRGRGMSDTP